MTRHKKSRDHSRARRAEIGIGAMAAGALAGLLVGSVMAQARDRGDIGIGADLGGVSADVGIGRDGLSADAGVGRGGVSADVGAGRGRGRSDDGPGRGRSDDEPGRDAGPGGSGGGASGGGPGGGGPGGGGPGGGGPGGGGPGGDTGGGEAGGGSEGVGGGSGGAGGGSAAGGASGESEGGASSSKGSGGDISGASGEGAAERLGDREGDQAGIQPLDRRDGYFTALDVETQAFRRYRMAAERNQPAEAGDALAAATDRPITEELVVHVNEALAVRTALTPRQIAAAANGVPAFQEIDAIPWAAQQLTSDR